MTWKVLFFLPFLTSSQRKRILCIFKYLFKDFFFFFGLISVVKMVWKVPINPSHSLLDHNTLYYCGTFVTTKEPGSVIIIN